MFGGSRDVLAVKDRSREWSNINCSERGMLIIIESETGSTSVFHVKVESDSMTAWKD